MSSSLASFEDQGQSTGDRVSGSNRDQQGDDDGMEASGWNIFLSMPCRKGSEKRR